MAWKVSNAVTRAVYLVWLAARCGAFGQEDPKQTGPLGLVIQYKCAPGQRVALRQHMLNGGLQRFEQWKMEGILKGYQILFSRYVDSNTWDMLALLTFSHYSDAIRWRNVERSMPAGLAPETLALTSSVATYPMDLLREDSAPETPQQPLYFVIPYVFSVPASAYLKYVDDYVRPQFEGWMKEGILSSYHLYLQRYTANRPWDTLIFLKYKDDAGFGDREKTVAKVRGQLQSNPTWKAASDSKQNLRVEKEAVIADELVLTRDFA